MPTYEMRSGIIVCIVTKGGGGRRGDLGLAFARSEIYKGLHTVLILYYNIAIEIPNK